MKANDNQLELQQAFVRAMQPCDGKSLQHTLDYLNDLRNMLHERMMHILSTTDAEEIELDTRSTHLELLDFARFYS